MLVPMIMRDQAPKLQELTARIRAYCAEEVLLASVLEWGSLRLNSVPCDVTYKEQADNSEGVSSTGTFPAPWLPCASRSAILETYGLLKNLQERIRLRLSY